MQKLCNLMQNDAINYEHCVREYYQPIIEDFGYIGSRLLRVKLGTLGRYLARIICFENNDNDPIVGPSVGYAFVKIHKKKAFNGL